MIKQRLKAIFTELKNHAPFTLFGSFTGIICMLLFRNLDHETSRRIFYVFHPGHVFLSAIVIASLFQLYSKKGKLAVVLLVGVLGSVGVGTLSDSIIPYAGEVVLGMRIDTHAHGGTDVAEPEDTAGHNHDHEEDAEHEHAEATEHEVFAEHAHIGFIEGWYIVIPAAIAGVLIAFFKPKTKFPHAGHVLLSTWASSFHMLMAMGGNVSVLKMIGSFGFLFLAVWIPCCFSDIVFPLLFVKSGAEIPHCHH
ncbi:MAG: hypothetical protein ACYSTT_05040 [Planctomycetota bacterium]|jgi:hypothetical protein